MLLDTPLRTTEFVVVDTETNGISGPGCEMTEIGAVLVGGGELHDRWSSVVQVSAPLRKGIQRFTGITQPMVDRAPHPTQVLPDLERMMRGRVLVAHNAPFDRRVLRQAFERCGMAWPDPPVLCTAAMARRLLPLQRERKLRTLADALGVDVAVSHRALPDAETCARVLCCLFPKLCAQAGTVAEAIALLKPASPRGHRRAVRARPPRDAARRLAPGERDLPELDFTQLPTDPGVYLFRDSGGRTLYVGKSVSIRTRARAHFAPSHPHAAWKAQAAVLDYRATASELGALVLENRLIKELHPPGNVKLRKVDDRLVYVRCRLDIAYPVLEVAAGPAAGRALTVGPLRGRRAAEELVEQVDSLFSLRHCGRTLRRRAHPSAYGQMGRCLSPCLGDLDPNLYRRRLDEALALFTGPDPGGALVEHVRAQMRQAAAAEQFERAEWLRRRVARLEAILSRLGGVLEATHARPRLVLARHPVAGSADAFWIVGGRVVLWEPLPTEASEALEILTAGTAWSLARAGRRGEIAAHLTPDEVDEVGIVSRYLASHPETPELTLHADGEPAGVPAEQLSRLLARTAAPQPVR